MNRGELLFSSGGKEYLLRLDFNAIMAIERRLGLGLFTLFGRFVNSDIRHTDLAVVIMETANAGAVNGLQVLSLAEAGEIVLSDYKAANAAAMKLIPTAFPQPAEGDAAKKVAAPS